MAVPCGGQHGRLWNTLEGWVPGAREGRTQGLAGAEHEGVECDEDTWAEHRQSAPWGNRVTIKKILECSGGGGLGTLPHASWAGQASRRPEQTQSWSRCPSAPLLLTSVLAAQLHSLGRLSPEPSGSEGS